MRSVFSKKSRSDVGFGQPSRGHMSAPLGTHSLRPAGHAIQTVERRGSGHFWRRAAVTVLVGLALVAMITSAWFSFQLNASTGSSSQIITIAPNSSIQSIADQLKQAGLISDATVFALYAKLGPARGSLKPGAYQLKGSMSMVQVIDYLAAGKIATKTFVVKDGQTINQLATNYEAQSLGTAAEFKEAVAATQLSAALTGVFGSPKTIEGFLLADTYQVAVNDAAFAVVQKMLTNFETKALPLFAGTIPGRLKPYQALVMASIIEKEGSTAEDRAGISQVFYNRLKVGMKLESDVTVIYLTGRIEPTAADLAIDSPYNTRRNPGLPPTPIDSPSVSAITAAMKPTTSENIYFIGGKDGKTYFAKTYAEHNENINKYLR